MLSTAQSARCRGMSFQAYGAIKLAADSEYLGELATGRWVDWAFGWPRGFTCLLVDVYKAIPSAEFVLFDHMSEGDANR